MAGFQHPFVDERADRPADSGAADGILPHQIMLRGDFVRIGAFQYVIPDGIADLQMKGNRVGTVQHR
ncbi:hypothetical protein D3C75_984000 [compost metagenome]